jgi:hypothetical protein
MRIVLNAWLHPIRSWVLFLTLGPVGLALPACQIFGHERLIYNEHGVQIGIQTDPSVQRSSPPAPNTHPASLSPQELLIMLGSVRVSGWSGTVLGWFEAPRPIPLFDDADLRVIVQPVAEAFKQAGPTQRVFFSLPNPKSAYGDATAGSLFMRHSYLHVVVTDHKAFARADTAGGDDKDVRDTKGMKLWVAAPYQPAVVSQSNEPEWAPFETVHISLNAKDMSARARNGAGGAVTTGITQAPQAGTESPQDLKLQIRELTQSNLDLRDRLNEQTRQVHDLKDELARLRQELDRSKPKSPATKKPASP